MMKMRFLYIFIVLFAAFPIQAQAEGNLPKLADDKAVTQGTLPNGTAYYIVSNPTCKGMADFALVQRTGKKTSDDICPSELAKDVLSSLTHIGGGLSPQKFFSSNGVNPSADGFVKVDDGHTVYRFSNLLMSSKAEVLDSTLLVLMGMVDKLAQASEPETRKWYAPADNALIIAGDVDAKSIVQKLKTLSYMTPSVQSQKRPAYEWMQSDSAAYVIVHDPSLSLSEVRFSWKAPRVPDKFVGTIQPYIQKLYLSQLGEIAVARVKSRLADEGIPYASVSYAHYSSSDGAGDEVFTVATAAGASSAEKVMNVMAETMSSLESAGPGRDEFEIARRQYVRKLNKSISRPVKSNSDYLDLCMRSFLYGAPLAKEADVLKVYTSRSVDVDTERQLLVEVADALLDPQKNLLVECRTPSAMQRSVAENLLREAWDRGKTVAAPASLSVSDTLLTVSSAPKVGVKVPKKDHISGGTLWTFSNDFKVVYKKMDTAGQIYWSMGMGAGFGSITDLDKGEGAFIGDCLWTSRIAGMSAEDFRKYLELRNIEMDFRVGLASSFLRGTVHKDNIRLMLRALEAVANEWEPDRDAYMRYMKNEQLRLASFSGTDRERKVVMDSLMCPDYIYSPLKSSGKLSEDLLDKAERFFEECFARMNDGVLVIVGDMDETELRKELLMQVGAFRTRKSAFYRPMVNYQPVSGWSTHTTDGDENSVYVTLSAPLPLTAENKMASVIAAQVLEQSLSAAIETTGMYVEVVSNTIINPQERFNVMISLKEASEDGFAAGIIHSGALEALRIMRTALKSLEATEVTDTVVKAYKEWLKNDVACRMKSPRYWVDAISMRHMEGKDFSTDYKARIDAVTTAKVRQILTSLNNARKVEYIIRKK